MSTKMIAYHGNKELKRSIIAELEAHRAADRLVKGRYWENGKGCAVGCTIKSGNHALYESMYGIPRILARLEDVIFEKLPNTLSQHWPVRFMSSINVGADLSLVQWHLLGWIVRRANPTPDAVVQRVLDGLDLRAQGLAWPDAYSAANAARATAYAYAADANFAVAAAVAAAYAASVAAAADARADARAADYAGVDAARATAYTYAAVANLAADAADVANAANADARKIFWGELADRMVRLLKDCK